MIFDQRIYTARPGRLAPHVDLFGKYGIAVYGRHVGTPVFFGMAESGGLNTYIHIWAYEDFAHREDARQKIHHDEGWTDLRIESQRDQNLVLQENSILLPAPFFKYEPRPAGSGEPKKAIFDHRTYTCHPGRVMNELKIYEEYGYEPQIKHLGEPLFYAYAETGRLNSYTHIWVYGSPGDRAEKRAAMIADEGWGEFRRRSVEAENRKSQETRIMTPAPFFHV